MNKLTIRQRIYLSLSCFAVLTIIGFGSAIVLSSDYLETQILDATYQDELSDIKVNLKQGITQLPQSSHVQAYWGTSGKVPNTFIRYGEGNYHDLKLNGHEYHLYVTPLNDDYLYLALKIDAIEHYEENLHYVLIVVGSSFLALCIWFGWWLTQFIAHPVSQLANDVSQLSPNDNQLQSQSNDPELSIIENAINDYIQNIQSHLLREQQFSGMASHELRTPIATMLATLETFQEDSDLNNRQKSRIDRLFRSAHELQFITESLLSSVRHPFLPQEAIDFISLIRKIILDYEQLYPEKDIHFSHDMDTLTIHTSPQYVKIIIGNLIKNALNHVNQGSVYIHIYQEKIEISDDGPGLPHSVEAWINDNVSIPYKEMGLGLYIVKTLCEKMGWLLETDAQPKNCLRLQFNNQNYK